MKIDLFNVDEFVKINHLKEVTSTILLQKGDIPHPEGLLSNEIFGVTTKSRKQTYAYINLYGHYFHPHVYKAIKRFFRNVDQIISGDKRYVLDKDGILQVNEDRIFNYRNAFSALPDNSGAEQAGGGRKDS